MCNVQTGSCYVCWPTGSHSCDTATKCLSSDSKPTLHLVAPTRLQLMKALTPAATDSAIVVQLKCYLGNQLTQYFTVSPLHQIATLLDPRLKNNDELITPEARQQAVTSLRQLVSVVPDDEDQQQAQAVQEIDDTSPAPPAKKMKLEDSFYASLFAHPSSATATEVCCCFDCIISILCQCNMFYVYNLNYSYMFVSQVL